MDRNLETDFNLKALLIEEELEFLIRNNGDQVSINDLDGKIIALYFNCIMGDMKWFDQELVEVYTELASKGENFEVIYIGDHGYGDEEFKACFSKMPWLAIPPLELEIQDHLQQKLFGTLPWYTSPTVPIIDGSGRLLNFDGYEAITDYDSDAYPFTPEKHTELKLKEDEQPLRFLLGSETRDFLIAYNGTKVPLSELEGKNVGVCFVPECDEGGCEEFIKSMKIKLKKIKEEFELVIIPVEAAYNNEDEMNKVNFQHVFKDLACLSIPLGDKRCCRRLVRRFYPINGRHQIMLMISGADGRRDVVFLLSQEEEDQEFASQQIFKEKMKERANVKSKTLESLLSSTDRDYIIRKGDIKVKISSLQGRTIILYFAPESVCCNTCTKSLVEAYHELHSKGEDLEVVFVSFHKDEHEFNQHFSKMPWLALPFSDTESHNKLKDRFPLATSGDDPILYVRDRSAGDILCRDAFWDLLNYGSKAYPFTNERIDQIKKEDEILKKKPQNLHKLLGSETRNFLISSTGFKVPISELEGKTVALYFRYRWYPRFHLDFYQRLEDMYFKLKERGEKFEIVSVFYNDDMTISPSSEEAFQGMPWLAVPLDDEETNERLFQYFHVLPFQNLIVVDSQGMILNNPLLPDFHIVVNDLGDEGYPFTLEKIQEVLGDETRPFNYHKASMKREERRIMKNPESIFISWQRDYLFGKDGIKFPASKLMGKTILLLSTQEIGEFERKLIEIYPKIKEKNSEFEVIFISDQELFAEMFSAMPWLLAIGYNDIRKPSIWKYFKLDMVDDDACAVAAIHRLGSGHSLTQGWRLRKLIMDFGADAYPFTKQRLRELEGSST